MKQALRSYLASIHPRNIKKLKELGATSYVYFFVFGIYALVAILPGQTVNDWIFTFIFLLIPMFFMSWSDMTSRYLMPKPMFLCPMKEEERKEYIRCVLKCKIGGPMILGIVIYLIYSIDYGFSIWKFAFMLFMYFSAGVASYMAYEYRSVNGEKAPFQLKMEDGKLINPWGDSFVQFATIFGIAVIVLADDYSPEIMKQIWPLYILLGGVLLIGLILMDVEIIKDHAPYILKNVGDYERNFKIQEKKEFKWESLNTR